MECWVGFPLVPGHKTDLSFASLSCVGHTYLVIFSPTIWLSYAILEDFQHSVLVNVYAYERRVCSYDFEQL